jgi:hypothetical protein
MATLITITMLVDLENKDAANAYLADRFQQLVKTLEDGGETDIIDWGITRAADVCEELNDAIANDTYSPGDFNKSWIISSATANHGRGISYWNSSIGWTAKIAATKYDCITAKGLLESFQENCPDAFIQMVD